MILGPLLFLIYINDLPSALTKLIPVMFADDTNLIIKGKNTSELVQTLNAELEILSDFLKSNKLKLNQEKTKIVCFRKKRNQVSVENLDIIFDGKKIICEKNVKFLGIILDEHLTFEDHCNSVANKMSRNTGILNRVKKTLPSPSLQLIFNSLIFSHYSYGLEVWGASPSKSFKRILTIQKKAIRSVTKSQWLAHTEPRMKKLGILKVNDQHKLQCINTTYDMLKGRCPDIFQFNEKFRNNITRRTLRSSTSQPNNLTLPKITTKADENSFPLIAPQFWNSLPEAVKVEENRNRFRNQIKSSLLDSYQSQTECANPLCTDINHHFS